MSATDRSTVTKVVVATTVMLSFISFWKAAAIVLCDLASSAYYAGGLAEGFVGKSAPWFILGIMLFSYAVRAVYVESCSMFVRGGVYRVVHEALGGTLAKFSVSALMFDYVLTGPISGVSAGLYLAGLINEMFDLLKTPGYRVYPPYFAAFFTVFVTLYFWRKNVIGIHESSQKALRIMQLTTVMVVTLIVWCLITIIVRGYSPVPFPTIHNIQFSDDAVGWLKGTIFTKFTLIAILIGLGHSVLAMSGEESLAQVNRELASPKLKNLKRTGLVVFIYSMVFTSLVSFFAVMLIPDAQRKSLYLDNLIGGLAMNVVGSLPLRILFHAFVVVVGTVILSGAVNTAIVGSNGVMNRVAEDGVLPDWFRIPHKKFGTTSRIIGMIVGLQIITVILTRGNITLLGDAYAFGIVWSFAMMGLSVLVWRFKRPEMREWKVPLNLKIGGCEYPIGLGLITLTLFAMAIANLFTKKVATVWGFGFTVVIFIAFELSEIYNKRKAAEHKEDLEKFRLITQERVSQESISVRPGNVLVAIRNRNQLGHLKSVLERVDTRKIDVVVLTVKRTSGYGAGGHELDVDQIFSDNVASLFSNVVNVAEKAGKHIELLVVPGRNYNHAIAQVSQRIQSSLVVMGLSSKLDVSEQAKAFGDAWEKLEPPRPQLSLEIIEEETGKRTYFNLGPHPPRLWPEDNELLHTLWLELSGKGLGHKLHHRDVVRVALQRLQSDMRSEHEKEVIRDLKVEASRGKLHKGNDPVSDESAAPTDDYPAPPDS
ncbi:MAG TPA: APC family permease [Acidobacteriota bacterium]|nr:APC family permease [Acidobacteriota bacterium]